MKEIPRVAMAPGSNVKKAKEEALSNKNHPPMLYSFILMNMDGQEGNI